jgi:uncharacterized damage-inducible protein DinB
MTKLSSLTVVLILLALGLYAPAQNQTVPKTGAPPQIEVQPNPDITFSRVLSGAVMHLQRVLMPLALAMPDDRYGFAPTNGEFKGVRTFAGQLKHVAATNYRYASAILGEKTPAEVSEEDAGPASLKTKTEILKYLNDSFSYVQKAIATVDGKNVISPIKSPFGEGPATRLAMVTLIIGHCYDHYGQLVEYARMNGIVPPASQQ